MLSYLIDINGDEYIVILKSVIRFIFLMIYLKELYIYIIIIIIDG